MVEDIQPTVTWSDQPAPDMVHIPLPPCSNCGAGSPLESIGIEKGSMLGGFRSQCSACGAITNVSGTYLGEVVDGDLRAIFYDADIHTLIRLRDALQKAQQLHEPTAKEVAEQVADVSPGLAAWLRNRENRRDVMTALTLLVTLIGILISHYDNRSAPNPSPVQIDQLIVQIEGQGQITDPGLTRKAPCWCGSGKKYKNCHAPKLPDDPTSVGGILNAGR